MASGIVFRSIFEGILEPKDPLWEPVGRIRDQKSSKSCSWEGLRRGSRHMLGKRRKQRCPMGRKTTNPGIADVAEVW